MNSIKNILYLGFKEFFSLLRDPAMLVLIAIAFTFLVYTGAKSLPDALNHASIAIVNEDHSPVSERIVDAFLLPYFKKPDLITISEMDAGLDTGKYTFALDIPPDFQKDLLAGRVPEIQLNIDATYVYQALNGNGYIQTIVNQEVNEFLNRYRSTLNLKVNLPIRIRFNQTLNQYWFGAIIQLINQITLLSIILTGAAILREREHGTIEHLLAMPITPIEIMVSKIWAMAVIVLLATIFSIIFVVQGILSVPIQGSVLLFLVGVTLNLFATSSLGIFMGTISRSMPQFALLAILTVLPLELLSGGFTPQESMPKFVREIMQFTPTPHFVTLAKAILFRGAGIEVVWPQFLALIAIGTVFFITTAIYFRKAISILGE